MFVDCNWQQAGMLDDRSQPLQSSVIPQKKRLSLQSKTNCIRDVSKYTAVAQFQRKWN